ncbi:hypothetical protein SORBI_3004G171800 [Sorghum bicolor]|uniref:Uncharacterized protein n=1 Tax=Sorghum bicolor TaxID=4558 RepID=A0A194YQ96_SORBI|nr:hypothetical protein SORBI_3004G171800 [Sorghum bicolor]KXG30362.1 hypothetical protein SORBI_3004G171800 [Sorghum bicolor]OQU85094.1 hypothetical protein SORBI_3004G171800 [Sorghum bicolor]OQU85095.1 hypothetical protein SORBI_3004G171800 [Sorghum bicolor]
MVGAGEDAAAVCPWDPVRQGPFSLYISHSFSLFFPLGVATQRRMRCRLWRSTTQRRQGRHHRRVPKIQRGEPLLPAQGHGVAALLEPLLPRTDPWRWRHHARPSSSLRSPMAALLEPLLPRTDPWPQPWRRKCF